MSEQELRTWLEARGLLKNKTEAAATLGIAYPTLITFLRGTRPSDETVDIMKAKMAAFDKERENTPKPAA